MADNKKFIEDNKEVLIEEMAEKINNLSTIVSSILESPIDAEVDGSLMRTYLIAASMQIGSLTALFNQYYVLLNGVIQREARPTGFASLIKDAKPKVSGSSRPATEEETEEDAQE